MVAHVLLLETENGLVLVDSGFGLRDIEQASKRIGPIRHLVRPALDASETAVRQVERLGFSPEDVRHVVLTHLDVDHVGGIADFPHAQIHTTAAEYSGAIGAPTLRECARYRSAQFDHAPNWNQHSFEGDSWLGFASATELTQVASGLVLVSLPGHSRGHACVAVDTGHGWLLHAGDAFYHSGALFHDQKMPRVLAGMERTAAWDYDLLLANQARLIDLARRQYSNVRIISAHDPTALESVDAH